MVKNICFAIVLALCSISASAQNADAIIGKWLSATGEGQIQVYKKESKFFGKLSWIKAPNDDQGKPRVDDQNPDKSLRSRPILGLELLKNFTFDGDNVYENGTIYDPKNGKTYSCKMTLKGDILKIRGYIGISLLGRSENWTRVK